jgi:hypothetical protein
MSNEINKKERDRILRVVRRAIGKSDRIAVNDALLKVLLFQITHPPKGISKWEGVRWLLSEMAQFALKDYEL